MFGIARTASRIMRQQEAEINFLSDVIEDEIDRAHALEVDNKALEAHLNNQQAALLNHVNMREIAAVTIRELAQELARVREELNDTVADADRRVNQLYAELGEYDVMASWACNAHGVDLQELWVRYQEHRDAQDAWATYEYDCWGVDTHAEVEVPF